MSKEKYVKLLEGVSIEPETLNEMADMSLVKKVEGLLKSADKTTLMTIAKWIREETDKIK